MLQKYSRNVPESRSAHDSRKTPWGPLPRPRTPILPQRTLNTLPHDKKPPRIAEKMKGKPETCPSHQKTKHSEKLAWIGTGSSVHTAQDVLIRGHDSPKSKPRSCHENYKLALGASTWAICAKAQAPRAARRRSRESNLYFGLRWGSHKPIPHARAISSPGRVSGQLEGR